MRIGTANIRNHPDMPRSAVEADIHTVVKHTSLCGLQEIQPGEDTPVVRYSIPGWWGMIGGECEAPIIWNSERWHLTDQWVHTWKRPKLSRPENPTPGIVSGVFRSHKRKSLPRFAVVNTHLVAGGYNVQRLPDVKRQWDIEWAMVQAEIARLHAMALTVYVLGDFNRGEMPGRGWLTPDGPPDHLREVVNTHSVYLFQPSHEAVVLNSDHKLHKVTGALLPVPPPG